MSEMMKVNDPTLLVKYSDDVETLCMTLLLIIIIMVSIYY